MDLVRRLLGEPSLTAEEEHRLAVLARAGDDDAREVLLRRSLRLAALRVWALGFRGDDVDDALQVAVLALMSAVARFDPDRGARLATYAWPWITRALHAHREARPEVPHDVVPEPRDRRADPSVGVVAGHLAGLPRRERAVLGPASAARRRAPARPRGRTSRPVSAFPCPRPGVSETRPCRDCARGLVELPTVLPEWETFPRSSIGRAFDC